MESELTFVDCHAHIYDEDLAHDLEEVLVRARKAGVKAIIGVSEELGSAKKLLELSQQYPIIQPCAGVHPVPVDKREQLEEVRAFVREHHERLIGIGECGLDFSPWAVSEPSSKEDQRWALEEQIKLAKEYDLPLNVHSRSAGRPTIEWLKLHNAKNVVLHAFDGSVKVEYEIVKQGVSAGFYFSVPPSIVRSTSKENLAKVVPMHQLLLETDSPVLGPTKEGRNEPMNVMVSCEFIAKAKDISPNEVAEATTANAKKLFPKLSLCQS